MKCDGKCYLAKMQHEQNEEDATNRLKQLQTEIVYYNSANPVYVVEKEFCLTEKIKQATYYNKLYSFLFTSYLVKPPDAITLS